MAYHHSEGPYCGARSIQYKIENEAVWVRPETNMTLMTPEERVLYNKEDEYYQSCKFIHARYNCTRFNNSATHYKIDFHSPTSSMRNKCRIPSRHSIIRILERRPINIFFVGDSHVQQIFESIICTFQTHIRDILLYEREEAVHVMDLPAVTKENAFGRRTLQEESNSTTNSIINNQTIITSIPTVAPTTARSPTAAPTSPTAVPTSPTAVPTSPTFLPTPNPTPIPTTASPTNNPTIPPEIVIAKIKQELNSFSRKYYSNYEKAPECHTIAYGDYVKFGLAKVIAKNITGECTLSHVAGQVSCAKIYAVNYSNPLAYSWLCFSYVRPLKGHDAINFALNHSISMLNTSINRFDVIVANTYISGSALSKYLKDRHYHGRILALPKFPFGNQSNTIILNNTIAETLIDDYEEYNKNSDNTKRFCQSFTWAKVNGIDRCNSLDFTKLIYQRNLDSKSSIYPLTYNENGKDIICQVDQFSPNNCQGKDFKVCRSKYCNEESHFCMPGPTDAFSMVVLAAALSTIDHNGQIFSSNLRNSTSYKVNGIFPKNNYTNTAYVASNGTISKILEQNKKVKVPFISPIMFFLIGLLMGIWGNYILNQLRKFGRTRRN